MFKYFHALEPKILYPHVYRISTALSSQWAGLYVTSLSADDIDGLDFKIPEVDLDVPDIDIGETVDMT